MELTYEEQEAYLLRIFTGTEYNIIKKGNLDIIILFKYPNNSSKLLANIKYKHMYDKAISEGMLPMNQLEELIATRGIFTDKDIEKLNSLESKLSAQQVLLAKTTKVRANQDRIKKVISELTEQINKIRYKKNSTLMLAADIKAEEERNMYFCWSCSFAENNTQLWSTYEDFLTEKDTHFKEEVFSKFLLFYRGISTEIIRNLARSNLWRIRYITSQKTAEQMFGIPTSDYSNDMVNLAYWSNFYQNVYEMMPEDKPSDLIIDDDEALDAYMKEYYEERSRDAAAAKGRSRVKGSMSAFDKEEVIVTQSNELYQDIKYDKPREAQKYKEQANLINKRKKR